MVEVWERTRFVYVVVFVVVVVVVVVKEPFLCVLDEASKHSFV